MTQQVECEWKVRYEILGAHVHCTLFARPKAQSTWQNCGHFVLGTEQWVSWETTSGIKSEQKEREAQ